MYCLINIQNEYDNRQRLVFSWNVYITTVCLAYNYSAYGRETYSENVLWGQRERERVTGGERARLQIIQILTAMF